MKQEIKNLIQEVLSSANLEVKDIIIDEIINKDNSSSLWFRIDVENPRFFLHKEGTGLLALNHIIKRILEKKFNQNEGEQDKKINFIIDINDFQKNKVDSVKALAHMMAERARYFKSNIELEPMSPFERRIVHEFLSDFLDIKTESLGFGPNRKIVIKYISNNF